MSKLTLKRMPAGPFACHSCMVEAVAPHLEVWDWGRDLCFACAATLGAKLTALSALTATRGADENSNGRKPDLFEGEL